jgi:UDP-glucose 4-epimerase
MGSALTDLMHDRRVLVTGGAGFIGSHLVEALVAGHNHVTVLDNLSTGSMANLARVQPQIEVIVGELGALLCAERMCLKRYSHIFHLAANAYIPPSVENPLWDFQTNLHNTILLLEALRRLETQPHVIFASSAAVYGNPVRMPISEDDPTVPISPYGVGKLAAERYLYVYSRTYGVRATTLRLFSIYGPRQRKQVVYDLLGKLLLAPHRLDVYGDGTQVRDFAYVDDVVQAMLLAALRAPGAGEVYRRCVGPVGFSQRSATRGKCARATPSAGA